MHPVRPAVTPGKTGCQGANGVEISFEVGKGEIAGGIIKTFSAGFAGRTDRQHARLDRFDFRTRLPDGKVQAIVTADFKQARIALAVIQIPFQRGGHGYNSGRAQHVGFFRERIRKARRNDTFGAE